MSVLHVRLRQGEIGPDHFHSRVPKQHLQRVGVPTIAEKVDSERMSETVRVALVDTRSLAQRADEEKQSLATIVATVVCD